jgi:hypothetical protein
MIRIRASAVTSVWRRITVLRWTGRGRAGTDLAARHRDRGQAGENDRRRRIGVPSAGLPELVETDEEGAALQVHAQDVGARAAAPHKGRSRPGRVLFLALCSQQGRTSRERVTGVRGALSWEARLRVTGLHNGLTYSRTRGWEATRPSASLSASSASPGPVVYSNRWRRGSYLVPSAQARWQAGPTPGRLGKGLKSARAVTPLG